MPGGIDAGGGGGGKNGLKARGTFELAGKHAFNRYRIRAAIANTPAAEPRPTPTFALGDSPDL